MVSLITAVYNGRAFLEDCLGSVNRQTYGDIEHIIVDGGSTDGTVDVLRRHAGAGVRWVSEPDRGLYDALNKGIGMANGEVVGILHSDDCYPHERVVEDVVRAIESSGAESCYGDLEFVSREDASRIVARWRASPFGEGILSTGWMPPHPTLFVRREVFKRCGEYDTGFQVSADYEWILRAFGACGMTTCYIPEVLVRMRWGGRSNRNLRSLIVKSLEDYRALKKHRLGGILTVARKNAAKLPMLAEGMLMRLRSSAAERAAR
jgi:glycosyltransferase